MGLIQYKKLVLALGVYQCGVFFATCYLLTWLLWNTGNVMQVQQSMVDVYSLGQERVKDALYFVKYVTYGHSCNNGTICNCSNFQKLWESPRDLLSALSIPPSPRLVNQKVSFDMEVYNTEQEMEPKFFEFLTMLQAQCDITSRVGNDGEGGWSICADPLYEPKQPCLVYSFGMKEDLNFETDLAILYGCEVHSFEPSQDLGFQDPVRGIVMHKWGIDGKDGVAEDKGWTMKTLRTIRNELGHSVRTIDLLKLDVEFYEWSVLQSVLHTGELRDVKHLLMEVHMGPSPDKARMLEIYRLLSRLEKNGFKRYSANENPACHYQSKFTERQLSFCFEMAFINIRFM